MLLQYNMGSEKTFFLEFHLFKSFLKIIYACDFFSNENIFLLLYNTNAYSQHRDRFLFFEGIHN